jgi:proton glutamate symport protein
VRGRGREAVLHFCEGLTEDMFKFIAIVMKFAPFGIGAAMAYTVGHSGLSVLLNLAKLVLTLYAALIVLCLLVFVPAALWARV